MTRLQSKVCVVTGASSGLGRAIALAFAAEGASLVVCGDLSPLPIKPAARTTAANEQQAEKLDEQEEAEKLDDQEVATDELICRTFGSGKALFVQADVTVADQVEQLVGKAVEVGGKLDVFVNNAGVGPLLSRLHDHPEDVWDRTINVNLRGPFLGCKYAVRQFLKQDLDANGHRGWIINIASIVALREAMSCAAYGASKAAVVSFTKTVALDYAPDKIHCNAICPGFLKTSMMKDHFEQPELFQFIQQKTPLGVSDSNTDDVARAAVFLASEDAAWITGAVLPVDGAYNLHL